MIKSNYHIYEHIWTHIFSYSCVSLPRPCHIVSIEIRQQKP